MFTSDSYLGNHNNDFPDPVETTRPLLQMDTILCVCVCGYLLKAGLWDSAASYWSTSGRSCPASLLLHRRTPAGGLQQHHRSSLNTEHATRSSRDVTPAQGGAGRRVVMGELTGRGEGRRGLHVFADGQRDGPLRSVAFLFLLFLQLAPEKPGELFPQLLLLRLFVVLLIGVIVIRCRGAE